MSSMFEYYQGNILCVQSSWLIAEGILSKSNYDALTRRGHIKKLTVGGNGRKALIQFDTMRSDLKEKIIAIAGDPYEKVTSITFTDYIENDQKAMDFYKGYTIDNGSALPEKTIMQYCCNVSIINACHYIANSIPAQRKALGGSKSDVWKQLAEVISKLPKHTYPHSLPSHPRKLREKVQQFLNEGFECLIHGQYGSKNAEKLNDEAKSFVFARWCDRVKRVTNYGQLLREYNIEAEQQGWKVLKSEQSLINFLTDPKVENLWYGYRYGELKAKEKYTFQHSTVLPSVRDSLWYSDGTKLNFYYRDDNGKLATVQVYEVMDAYSEVFLGYHISKTEDYEAQYQAYKMALQISGHRPYQISFDNQGGHKKLESGNFLNKISHLAIKTQPYNGKSKTIESAFGRFQTQYLAQKWFFTGQNITAKKVSSRANMEMVLENADKIPTLPEIKAAYLECRQQWNSAAHPKTGKPRIDMYYESFNEKAPAVSPFQMVDFFWIEREKPVTCTASGISFKEKNVQYDYVVYDKQSRSIDLGWLRKNVDRKFIIKFDPDDMTLVYLYEKTPLGLRFITEAETKPVVHRGKQEQEAFEADFIKDIENQNKVIRIQARDEVETVLERFNMRAEDYGLRSPRLKGIESNRKVKIEKTDIAKVLKDESNAVLTEDNIYRLM